MNNTGKGGFGDHPENINKNSKGRGLKGTTITDIMVLILDGKEDTIPASPKKEIALKWYHRVLGSDKIDHLKLLLQYHDGMPRQALEITGAEGEELYPRTVNLIFGDKDK